MADKTVIVGRVAVKVSPDTTRLPRELKEKLRNLERTLKPIQIEVELARDVRDLSDKVKAATREAQRAAEDIEVHVGAEYDKSIKKAVRQIDEEFKSISDKKIMAKAVADLDDESMRTTKRKIRKLKDDLDDLKATIQVDIATPSYQRVKTALAWLARTRFVTLIPTVSKTAAKNAATTLAALSGARMVGDILGDLWDGVKNLDKSVPKIVGLSTAFMGLTSSIFASVSNVAALITSLAAIAPLALSLPGIFGGLAIGAGITFAALKDINKVLPGIKKGFSEIQDVISSKFWDKAKKPIKELADKMMPRLRTEFGKTSSAVGDWFGGFAKEIGTALGPAIGGMFKNLNGSIGIFKGATKPLAGIITSLGKMGSALLPDLAKWAGKIVGKFDEWLVKIQKDGTWEAWVKAAKTAFADLGRVFKATFGIFAEIGKIASDSGGSGLGILADTLESIRKTVGTSEFKRGLGGFFKGAHGFFKGIGKSSGALLDLFEALGTTFEVVAPRIGEAIGGFIKTLAEALAKPSTQDAIKSFFTNVAGAIEDLAPVLPSIVDAFAALAKALGEFIKAAGPSLGTIFQALADALIEIAPILPDLAKEVFPLLAQAVKDLAPVLAGLVKDVLPAMVELFKEVLPYIKDAVTWFANFAKENPKLAGLAIVLGALATSSGLLGAALGGLTKLTFTLAGKFVLMPLLRAIGGLAAPIGTAFKTMITSTASKIPWGGLLSGMGKLSLKGIPAVGTVLLAYDIGIWVRDNILDGLVWADQHMPDGPFKDFAIGVGAMLKTWLDTTTGGAENILDNIWPDRWPWEDDPPPAPDFTTVTTSIDSFITDIGAAFAPLGAPLGTKVAESTKGAIDKIAATVAAAKPGVGTAVTDLFGSVSTAAQTAIAPVPGAVQTVIDKAKAALAGSRSAVDASAATAVGGAVGKIKEGLSGAPGAVTGAVAGMSAAMTVGRAVVAIQAAALGTAATPKVPNMYDSGQSIGSSLAAGISSMWSTVSSAASGLMAAARGFFPFSPAKEGPFSGKGWVLYSGISIGEAFADGLVSQVSVAQSAAKALMAATHSEFTGYKPPTIEGPSFAPGTVGGLDANEVADLSMNRVIVNVNNINPVAEKGSTSVNRNMQRLAMAGVI